MGPVAGAASPFGVMAAVVILVGGAALSGLLAYVTGVGAVYLLLQQVPLWAAAAAVLLGVTGTAACGHVAWRSWRHPSPPALQWRGVPG